MDPELRFLLWATGSLSPMNPPVSFVWAMLALAPALPAQCLDSFAEGDFPKPFRDLTIGELVDAAELLANPGRQVPRRPRLWCAPDLQDPEVLLFCDIALLAPVETKAIVPREPEAIEPFPSPPSAGPMTPRPAPAAFPAGGGTVTCSASGPEDEVAAHSRTQPEVSPVPEPSVIVLLAGAAAWILLRRKH